MPQQKQPTTLPDGIEIRYKSAGKSSIRISFYYKGMRCRETLNLEATKANIKYAVRLRGEILNQIERNTFSYPKYFPNSKRAKLFITSADTRNPTVEELLREYLAQAERTVQYSTYKGYKDKTEKHLIPTFGALRVKDLK